MAQASAGHRDVTLTNIVSVYRAGVRAYVNLRKVENPDKRFFIPSVFAYDEQSATSSLPDPCVPRGQQATGSGSVPRIGIAKARRSLGCAEKCEEARSERRFIEA